MKPKKNKTNTRQINVLIFVVFLISLISKVESQDCSNCPKSPCSITCKKNHKTNNYISCTDYTKYYYTITNGVCKGTATCSSNLPYIYEGECVESCKGAYQLGDFCYPSCNSSRNQIVDGEESSKCKCKDVYYISTNHSKTEYVCLDSGQSCPKITFQSYDDDTKRCLQGFCSDINTTTTGITKKVKQDDANFKIPRCSYQCKNDEFEYDKISKDGLITYCVDKCPPEALYHYPDNSDYNPHPACYEKCNNQDFSDEKYNCYSKCPYKTAILNKIDVTQNVFQCYNKTTCPSDYPYIYESSCFKTCGDVKKVNMYQKDAYAYVNGTTKKCITNCNTTSDAKFFDEKNSKCVKSCSDSDSGPYNFKGKCKTQCDAGYPFYTCDKNECVFSCDDNYCLDTETKACVKKGCAGFTKIFKNYKKECVTCDVPKDPDNPKNGEGFYIPNDNNYTCYVECPYPQLYHNNKDNKCIEFNSPEAYKYRFDSSNKTLYQKCTDISSSFIYVKNDTYCYSACNDFYIESNNKGIYNCTSDIRSDCYVKGYKYLRGNECVKQCNTDEYIVFPQKSYTSYYSMGQCYSHYSNCTSYFRHNLTSSIECYQTNCSLQKLYSFPNNPRECVEQCQQKLSDGTIKYLYYDDENTCLESCKGLGKYALEATSEPQKCSLLGCPGSTGTKRYYFYEDKKICSETPCNMYKNSTNNTICVESCAENEKLDTNNSCVAECPFDYPFFITIKKDETLNINIKRCVKSCLMTDPLYKYYINDTKECMTECPPSHHILNDTCVEACPNYTYYDPATDKCTAKCPSNLKYFRKATEKNHTYFRCVHHCNEDEYITSKNECVLYCPDDENFIGYGHQCLKECKSDNNGDFYSIEEKDTIQATTKKLYPNRTTEFEVNYTIYRCIKTCGNLYNVYPYQCSSTCDNYTLDTGHEKKCYSLCHYNSEYSYSYSNGNKKVCLRTCSENNDGKIYYDTDKVCRSKCDSLPNTIKNLKDNSCVSKCDLTSDYKFELESSMCVKECNGTDSYYFSDNYKCINKSTCLSGNIYLHENHCRKDGCPANYYAHIIFKTDGKTPTGNYECKKTVCDGNGPYYYFENKKCLTKCNDSNPVIDNSTRCVSSCENIVSTYKYYLYDHDARDNTTTFEKYKVNTCVLKCPEDEKFLEVNKCVKKCSEQRPYYKESDYVCLEKCPNNTYSDGYVCTNLCPGKKFLNEYGQCVSKCNDGGSPNGLNYYVKGDNVCLRKCPDNYFLSGFQCDTHCNTDEFYFFYDKENKKCTGNCPQSSPYFVYQFTQGEVNLINTCLNRCPKNYSFFVNDTTQTNPDSPINYRFICYGFCPTDRPYYITDKNIFGQKCVKKCDSDVAKYFIGKNNECLKECQYPLYYYTSAIVPPTPNTANTQCIEKCNGVVDNITDPHFCYAYCRTGYGHEYNLNGYCVESCGDDYYYYVDSTTSEKICTKTCKEQNKFFYKNDNKCYDKCEKGGVKSKYYDPDTNECLFNCTVTTNYKFAYPIAATDTLPKACVKSCLESEYYYQDENICLSKCDKYYSADKKKCVTKCEEEGFKYISINNRCSPSCNVEELYYSYLATGTSEPVTKCVGTCGDALDENGKKTYKYFNSKKECVKNCTDNYVYNGGCYESCPANHSFYEKRPGDDFYTCYTHCAEYTNSSKYHIKNTTECIPKCHGDYNKVIKGTYECLKECPAGYFYTNISKSGDNIICVERCDEFALDGRCIKKIDGCRSNQYLDTRKNVCVDKCPDELPFFIKNKDKTTNGAVDFICRVRCDTGEYVTSKKECVSNCPPEENYIGANNTCRSDKCTDPTAGPRYILFATEILNTKQYEIYQCLPDCPVGYPYSLASGGNQCFSKCPTSEKYVSKTENKCFNNCLDSKFHKFSLQEGTDPNINYFCADACSNDFPAYTTNKVCQKDCSSLLADTQVRNITGECVKKCDFNSDYKFEEDGKCVTKCSDTKVQYSEKDFKCVSKCEEPHQFIFDNKCVEQCPTYYFANPRYKDDLWTKEYECRLQCESSKFTKYYDNGKNKICVDDCKTQKKFTVIDSLQCVDNCASLNTNNVTYYVYKHDNGRTNTILKEDTCVIYCPKDTNFLNENGTCAESCDVHGYKYYLNSSLERYKTCLKECPSGSKIYGQVCKNECPSDKKFLNEKGECVAVCNEENSPNGYSYYKPNENTCLEKCPPNYYIDGKECLTECKSTNRFASDNACLSRCPLGKEYYVDSFKYNETKKIKTCLEDCPVEYPYYVHEESGIYSDNKCYVECPSDYYFFESPDISTRVGKKCLKACPTGKPYIGKAVGKVKECLKTCTDPLPYFNNKDLTNYTCLSVCPSELPYHNPGSYGCIDACSPNAFNYDGKVCVSQCEANDYKVLTIVNTVVRQTVCLKDCNNTLGPFSNLRKECVKTCDAAGQYLKANTTSYKCECINKYYIDETGIQVCIEKDCINNATYSIIKYGTRECIKTCTGIYYEEDGIKYCFTDEKYCPTGMYEKVVNGQKICDCPNRFYYDSNKANRKKICLGKNVNECPLLYNFYVKETKECVHNCSDASGVSVNYYTGHTCINHCPTGKVPSNTNECVCPSSVSWYNETGEDPIVCLNNLNCIEKYPVLIATTRQCISKCYGSHYPIYYRGKCYSSCNETLNDLQMVDINKTSPEYIYSNKTCKCRGIWYKDYLNATNDIVCDATQQKTNCASFNPYYSKLIPDTGECVRYCPEDYFYYFRDKCFKKCEDGYTKYSLNIKTVEGSRMCGCRNYWVEDETTGEITCLGENVEACPPDMNKLVFETKQCLKPTSDCPDNTVIFNGVCYKKTACPTGTHYNITSGERCVCDDLWFTEGSKTICLSAKICPNNYPYLDYEKRECLKNDNDCFNRALNIFNFVCYSKAPINTKIDPISNNTYICDKIFGYWTIIHNNTNEKNYLQCGLNKCPSDKPLVVVDTKECIVNCGERVNTYLYNNTCVSTCPPENTSPDNTTHKCIFLSLTNGTDLESTKNLINAQINNLHSIMPPGGIVLQEFNSTLHIYSVNKDNKQYKQLAIQSGMSFIDLDNCLSKIYETYHLSSSEDLVVVTYNLHNSTNGSLIDPVEYELFRANSGQKINGEICDKSIDVSYSLEYVLNNNYQGKEATKVQNLFQLGKKLNQNDKDIDTFNENAPLYSDICVACDINGKDLVMQDRKTYLYPNLTTCEENCTYDHTDFEKERIYCKCPIKRELDFNRKNSLNATLNLATNKAPEQSRSNSPVIKCSSSMGNNIEKNAALYVGVGALAVEAGMVVVGVVHGFASIGTSIGSALSGVAAAANPTKKKKKKDINNDNNYSNPPPKAGENEEPESKEELIDKNKKVDFIPQEFVSMFFKDGEKGATKQCERSKLPFKVGPKVKLLLQRHPGINYNEKKMNGPYSASQNILEVIDPDETNKVSKYKKDDPKNISASNEIVIQNMSKEEKEKAKPEGKKEIITIKTNSSKQSDKKSPKIVNSDEKMNTDDEIVGDRYEGSDVNIDDELEEKPKMYDRYMQDYGTLFGSIKKEIRFLKKNYQYTLNKDRSNLLTTVLANIFHKIYIVRIIFFRNKYELFSLYFSLYILYHFLMLTILAGFYDINTIRKIWERENYPDITYYLLHAFFTILIVGILYNIACCLFDNEDKIKELLILARYNKNKEKDEEITKKKEKLMKKIKIKMIVFYIIEFLIMLICFFYLLIFCAVYTGTKVKVFNSYLYTLILALFIKIGYGLICGVLRKTALCTETGCLYELVQFFDSYLS